MIFFISAMILFLFAIPKYQESNVLQSYIEKKQSNSDSQSSYYMNLSKLLASVDSQQEMLAKMDNALPSDYSVTPIVYFIQSQAELKGMSVKSIVFSQQPYNNTRKDDAGKNHSLIKSAVFEVNLSGTYQGFKNFLLDLEQSDRLFQINYIKGIPDGLSHGPIQGQFMPMDFTLQAIVYFQ